MNSDEQAAQIMDHLEQGTFRKVHLTLLDPFGVPVITVEFHDPDPGTGALLQAYHSDTNGIRVPVKIGPNHALPHVLELWAQ